MPRGYKRWEAIRARKAAELGPEHAERVAAARQAMEDAVRLTDLREARGMTQAGVAEVLEVSRARVSALEKQRDVYLSTLREYVEALGGRLEVAAVFDDGRVVIDQTPAPAPARV